VARATAGITVVLNFDGDRGFVTHMPPTGEDEQPEPDRWREVLRSSRPGWCYLHAGPGVPALLREARELGCKIVLDMSLGEERDERDTIIECAALADIFVPNADELMRLTGTNAIEPAVAAATQWGTQLVIKRGAAGALVAGADGSVTEVRDGVREVTVADLTGAGDSFAGAMIAALLGGARLTEAVVAGNTAGSLAVGRLGAVGQVRGTGMGAGWPLQPKVVREVATAVAAPWRRRVMEQGR
jgi:sugar/nucleoside kinase (ribokinase family)